MIKSQENQEIPFLKLDTNFFKLMYDTETLYYSNPSNSSFNYLMHLYKEGIDYFLDKNNDQYVKLLTVRMNSLINLHFEIENNLKLIYLKHNIMKKLNKLEEPKKNALLEKKLNEESKEKIKKFKIDTNSNIIMIKIYLRNQRNNFIKKARNKLFKKFIKNNSFIREDTFIQNKSKLNINITPIKEINSDFLHHEIMIRTKGVSNMKQYFFPTQIFFDEETNFLFKNNINIIKKDEKFNIEEITKNFIGRYSLSYNTIIYEFIKKIMELLEDNYRKKYKNIKNIVK